MSISFFGLTFHLYGLIIGLAVLAAYQISQAVATRFGMQQTVFEKISVYGLVGALIGARLWHVATDWHLYQGNAVEILFVWQGGLSILGAVLGLCLGVWLYFWNNGKSYRQLLTFLDAFAVGLPFGQAIGRLGNYVNQELYGEPSTLPWAVTIDTQHRLPGYEQIATYHPLFAYEMMATLAAGVLLHMFVTNSSTFSTKSSLNVGTGSVITLYVLYYSVVRFLLDFLRIDKAVSGLLGLGTNQLILVATSILSIFLLRRIYFKNM